MDTANKVPWKFHTLVSEFSSAQVNKAKSENEILLAIKTIDLIQNTLLSPLCISGTSLKFLLKIINANLALTLEVSFLCCLEAKVVLTYQIGGFLAVF